MAASEMFGAPIGISAAEDQINQNVRGALLARKTLGEIEQQPAEMALKQAHARLYGAEADAKAAALRDQQMMERLSMLAAAETRAAREGREATADDLLTDTRQPSITEPFERMLRIGQEVGAPARLMLDIANKVTQMTRNIAVADNNAAEQTRRQLMAQQQRASRIASLAQAALNSPEQYQQLRMQAINEGFPAARLPEAFDEKILTGVRDAGLTAKEQTDIRFRKLDEDRKDKAEKRMNARDAAAIATAKARKELIETRTDLLKKEGGPNAQSSRDARQSLIDARRATQFAKLNSQYPMAPADPKLWVAGKTYRLPNGTFIQASQNGNTMGGTAIQVPEEVRRALYGRGSPSAAGAADDLEDDDEEALAD